MSGVPDENLNVLFIDSTCVLCDGFATRLLSVLKGDSQLRVASLFGGLFANLARQEGPLDEDAMVYVKDGNMHIGPSAVIALRGEVRFAYWALISMIRLVPHPVRVVVYRWVAKNRKSWFGSQEFCSLQNADSPDSWRYLNG